MKQLRQLIEVSKYQPPSGPLLALFELIEGGKRREEILMCFKELGRSPDYVNSLANRLKSNLLDGILLNSFNDYAEYNRKSFQVYKRYAACMCLIRSGNKVSGLPEAEKTVQKALELGMTNIALMLCLELENFLSMVNHRPKLKKYRSLSNDLQQEYFLETSLQRLLSEIQYIIKNNLPVEDFVKELNSISERLPGKYYRSNLFYFLSLNLVHRYRDDEIGILDTSKEAIRFFSKFKSPLPFMTSWGFRRQLIPIMVGHGQFAEAEATARQCMNQCVPGNYNWHLSLIYLALVGFHSNKPKIALWAWKKANGAPMKFENTKDIRERWLLIRSYLELYGMDVPGNFRLYRFLNSTPTLNADKSRNNVAVIISHLLHLWKDGKTESFGDHAKQLRSYINRHLKKPGCERPRWFLLMLEKFYESQYHPRRYEPRVKYLWKKIQSTPPDINANVFTTEVIPIEQAWAMIIGK